MDFNFKYVIIGSGSAGSVIANRLSENPNNSVCLIEAGPRDSLPQIKIPLAASSLFKNKKYGWCDESVPQSKLLNRTINSPRGKTLGGSSSINGMVYIRGQQEDYNTWLDGKFGWDYNSLLPYFISLENNQDLVDQYHGNFGPLWVETFKGSLPTSNLFMEACANYGLQHNQDFNGEEQEGYGHYQTNIKNGQRFSAADAFLKPIQERPNLTILTGAHVNKLIIHKGTAVGVEVYHNKVTQVITSNKDIVLSAGTFNSPKILMLSGIGGYEELEKHSITQVKDLPGVGKNLKDHLTVNLSVLLNNHHQTFKEKMSVLSSLKELSSYLFSKKGLFTYPAADIGVFFKSSADKQRPDAQIHFAPGAGKYHKNGKMSPESGITASVTILRPKSSGSLKIASSNPKDAPLIDPNYLSVDEDLLDLRNAVKITREILSSSPIKEQMIREILPGEDIKTNNDLDHFIQQTGLSVYHPVGTCKMGFDEMSVVDNNLKVWGIKNLRVADLSIAPNIISGNTNALGNVIGAKCADAILKAN